MDKSFFILVMLLAPAAGAVETPAGKWITQKIQFNSGVSTHGVIYLAINPGAQGSIWIDNVRCDGLKLSNNSFEKSLWSEGGRWGVWQLDDTRASQGNKSALALFTLGISEKPLH